MIRGSKFGSIPTPPGISRPRSAGRRRRGQDLAKLETRADEIGKSLGNKDSTKLHGCKEIKLRRAGLRIIFRVTTETVDVLRIVYVLSIEKRDLDFVFGVANNRLRRVKGQSNIRPYLDASPQWQKRSASKLGKKKRNRRK